MVLAAVALLAGCTIGPSQRPELVTSGDPGAAGPGGAAPSRTGTSTAPLPTGPGGPGRTAEPIAWQPCPDGPRATAGGRTFTLDCARVQVPRSYADTTSGTIQIAVERATRAEVPAGAVPLVAVLGGPGENGARRAATVAGSLPAELTARYSVLTVDLRGTGDSVGVQCLSPPDVRDLLGLSADPGTATGVGQLSRVARTVTFACTDDAGPNLPDFATVPATDDLDTLRAALGLDRLSVLGRGFGATLGAVYADRYPGRVARMVLDGPADPSLTSQARAAASALAADAALGAFVAACPGFTGGCPLGPRPLDIVTGMINRLDAVGVADPGGQHVTGGTVLLALLLALAQPAVWPSLAAALADLRAGNSAKIVALLIGSLGGSAVRDRLSAAFLYACNDSAQRLTVAQLPALLPKARVQAPVFGPYLLAAVTLCSDWPAPATPLGPVTAAGAPPLLVLASVDDPLAALRGTSSMVARMPSAVLVRWQSGTHGAYPASACITAAVDRYLLQGSVPPAGTLCPP